MESIRTLTGVGTKEMITISSIMKIRETALVVESGKKANEWKYSESDINVLCPSFDRGIPHVTKCNASYIRQDQYERGVLISKYSDLIDCRFIVSCISQEKSVGSVFYCDILNVDKDLYTNHSLQPRKVEWCNE